MTRTCYVGYVLCTAWMLVYFNISPAWLIALQNCNWQLLDVIVPVPHHHFLVVWNLKLTKNQPHASRALTRTRTSGTHTQMRSRRAAHCSNSCSYCLVDFCRRMVAVVDCRTDCGDHSTLCVLLRLWSGYLYHCWYLWYHCLCWRISRSGWSRGLYNEWFHRCQSRHFVYHGHCRRIIVGLCRRCVSSVWTRHLLRWTRRTLQHLHGVLCIWTNRRNTIRARWPTPDPARNNKNTQAQVLYFLRPVSLLCHWLLPATY